MRDISRGTGHLTAHSIYLFTLEAAQSRYIRGPRGNSCSHFETGFRGSFAFSRNAIPQNILSWFRWGSD